MKNLYAELAADEFIKIIKVDENGFIILVTTKSNVISCT